MVVIYPSYEELLFVGEDSYYFVGDSSYYKTLKFRPELPHSIESGESLDEALRSLLDDSVREEIDEAIRQSTEGRDAAGPPPGPPDWLIVLLVFMWKAVASGLAYDACKSSILKVVEVMRNKRLEQTKKTLSTSENAKAEQYNNEYFGVNFTHDEVRQEMFNRVQVMYEERSEEFDVSWLKKDLQKDEIEYLMQEGEVQRLEKQKSIESLKD